jgi:hypothetical protein
MYILKRVSQIQSSPLVSLSLRVCVCIAYTMIGHCGRNDQGLRNEKEIKQSQTRTQMLCPADANSRENKRVLSGRINCVTSKTSRAPQENAPEVEAVEAFYIVCMFTRRHTLSNRRQRRKRSVFILSTSAFHPILHHRQSSAAHFHNLTTAIVYSIVQCLASDSGRVFFYILCTNCKKNIPDSTKIIGSKTRARHTIIYSRTELN